MLRLHDIGVLLLLGSSAGRAEVTEAISPRHAHSQASAKTLRLPPVGSHKNAVTPAGIVVAFGVVTNEHRTVAHNRRVGGVANSYHLQGRAIDVVRKLGVSHLQIQDALGRAGYRLIESLDEGDHSHFAFAQDEIARSPGLNLTVVDAPRAPSVETKSAAQYIPPLLIADNHGTLEPTGFVIRGPSLEGKAP